MKKIATCMLLAALVCSAVGAATLTASAETEAAEVPVITALDTTSSYPTDTEWESVTAQTMTGAGTLGGSVKLATIGTKLCILVLANDATNYEGLERIAFVVTVGETTVIDCQGHYENTDGAAVWLTNADAAKGDRLRCSYDAVEQQYRYEFARDLTTNYTEGAQVNVTITHVDAQDDQTKWGEGVPMTYSGTMRFEGTPLPPAPDKIVAVAGTGTEGHPSEEEWEQAKSYSMSGANEGTLQVLTAGTRLYLRASVKDTTNGIVGTACNDKMEYNIVANGKTHWEQGNWANWLNNDSIQFTVVQIEQKYDNTYGGYIGTFGVDLNTDFVKGEQVTVGFKAWDAGSDGAWGTGNATTIETTLVLDEYTPPEGIVAGPENTNLNVVVTDLAKMPTEKDWEEATAYAMIPVWGDTSGATGTVKILTAAQNIFIRMEVNDATSNVSNDGVYIYFGTEEMNFEARGNYDMWLPLLSKETFGKPSVWQMSTTSESKAGDSKWTSSGKYTYDIGYYIPELLTEGNTIRLCMKHRDSRSSAEMWADKDYTHTIYFDQTITFGKTADTTVRPQEETDGFTGSTANIHYNKVDITWSEWTGADSYMMYVYTVNEQGSEEPYTHLSIEGPVYSGEGSYSETIEGLTASTAYAVQIVVYDADNAPIAYSALIAFSTISREEDVEKPAEEPGGDTDLTPGGDTGTTPGGSTDNTPSGEGDAPDDTNGKGGCGSVVAAYGAWAFAALGVAAAALVLVRRRKD